MWRMFLPQYWKDWFLMLLVRFIILFPYPLFMKFGRMLGILCMLGMMLRLRRNR